MEGYADSFKPRMLVRSYSAGVEARLPSSQLAHVLASDAAGSDSHGLAPNPWRRFFEPPKQVAGDGNPVTKTIAVESKRLREKWSSFQDSCPAEDRLDLSRAEPTMHGIIDTVRYMNLAWKKKRESGIIGRALQFFHRFCDTLDSHSGLLKILPEGSEYLSVFMGSLNAIIRASVNHEKVAESLGAAFHDISEQVADVKADLEMYPTEEMLALVAELYAHVFLFLNSLMDWMMETRAKRLLKSFNDNLGQKFQLDVRRIGSVAQRINMRAGQCSRAEVRTMREDMERDRRLGLQGEERRRAEIEDREERRAQELQTQIRTEFSINRKQLVNDLSGLLEEQARTSLRRSGPVLYTTLLIKAETAAPHRAVRALCADDGMSSEAWTRDDVVDRSKDYESYFDRDRVRLPGDPFSPAMVDAESLERLREWAASEEPGPLWLEGPYIAAEDLGNPLSMLAARMVDLADKNKVPVLSYFCKLTPESFAEDEDEDPDETAAEVRATLALAYALVRQLVELLPVKSDGGLGSPDVSEARLALLDGSTRTWSAAMSLMSDLLTLMPRTVFCVVDGLNWVDDWSAERYVTDVLRTLGGKSSRLKVLYTTTGRCAALSDALDPSDTAQVRVRGFVSEQSVMSFAVPE
ncbi:hypothetical protein RB595_004025 [Gaeumannomyces hyphopodioides]